MSYYAQANHNFFAVYKNDCSPLIGYAHEKRMNNWLETQTFHPRKDIEMVSRETLIKRGDEEITKFNPFTGKNFVILARDAGGPCDPSTERYHTM